MMTKHYLETGFIWCEICNKPVGGEMCIEHMLDKPVTLSRYDAKTFYDMAIKLGIEEAYQITEQKDVIHELAELIRAGKVFYSLSIS